MLVKLDMYEIEAASSVGRIRFHRARVKKAKPMWEAPWDDNFYYNQMGAIAEYAFAKHTGLFWNMGSSNMGQVDFKPAVDVQWQQHDDLFTLQKGHDLELRYVMVTGVPQELKIHGWLYGHEIIKDENYRQLSKSYHAYAVPVALLHGVSTLEIQPATIIDDMGFSSTLEVADA